MLELSITDEIRRTAWAKSRDMGKLKNSITDGDGNLTGFIAEALALSVIGGKMENTYDYDFIAPNGLKIDTKAKKVTSAPMPHYECSVAAFNTSQACDYYAFVRVECIKGEYTRGWYLGHISKFRYYGLARFLKKGERDGDNFFCVKADCYNLAISELSMDLSVFNESANCIRAK